MLSSLIYKAIEKNFFFIFQPILKSPDITNTRYIEQNFLNSSEFIKTRVHLVIIASLFDLYHAAVTCLKSKLEILENDMKLF